MPSQLAEQVTEVPQRYGSSNRSTACLLEDAGFPDLRNAVSVEDVMEALERHPELVDLWLKRGSDQLVAGGWGIECQGDAYCIHSFSDGQSLLVRDRVRACAEFIVRYVRVIGDVQARTR